MNKTYVMAVDSMLAITANSEEEAREEAKQQFVEMLQKREVEFVCVLLSLCFPLWVVMFSFSRSFP